jgi:hypothetical protein
MSNIYTLKKKVGDIAEEKVIELVDRAQGRILHRPSNKIYFPYYDFVAENSKHQVFAIEVKNDTFPNDTVAIEFKQSGQDSGIRISTAHIYFIYKSAYDKLYWVYTNDLKAYIKAKSPDIKPCNYGGSESYMIPLQAFKPQRVV